LGALSRFGDDCSTTGPKRGVYPATVAEGQILTEDEHEHDAETEARRRVALAQIRQYPDPALRLRANDVESFDGDLEHLARRMTHLMHDAHGVGLAATQIGVLRRVFVFQRSEDEVVAVVNPVIVRRSKDTDVDKEGCLSLQGVHVPVERNVAVTLEGQDVSGAPLSLELEDLPARVVQHELDHLDGVLIVERTNPESRREALATLRRQPTL
jgi:peptide deformylase